MKYTKELLEEAAKKSTNVMDVLRYIKCPISGGGHGHITKQLKKFNVDTSHFKKSLDSFKAGQKKWAAFIRISAADILTVSSVERRVKTRLLVRALKEMGREYKCEKCKITSYNGSEISFEVDHINGNWKDNREENLRFLCPNCHSQEKTNYSKNVKYTDEKILNACKISANLHQVTKKLGTGTFLYPRIKQVMDLYGIKFQSPILEEDSM